MAESKMIYSEQEFSGAYHAGEVADVLGATIVQRSSQAGGTFSYLATDTRRLTYPSQSLFIALSGPRRDGHQFLKEAYERGVRVMLVGRPVDAAHFPESCIMRVPDTLVALQQLAQYHRRRFDLPVIGITGSNGKTIVKEWLFQALQPDYQIVRSPRSYNSQIGVPLSIWNINPQHTLGIFEAGISRPGEMQRLSDMLRCGLGVFTNLGAAHDEGFENRQEKLEEKCRLFEYAHTVVYCRDYPQVEATLRRHTGGRLFSWSMREDADLRVVEVQVSGGVSRISARYCGEEVSLEIPFTGYAAIENALHCAAVMLVLGCQPSVVRDRLSQLEPVAMRLELKAGLYGSRLINDSYNSDLNGLEIALDFLQQHSPGQARALVLSDILQSGMNPDRLYQQVARLVIRQELSHFVGIGTEVGIVKRYLPPSLRVDFYESTETFLRHFNPVLFRNAVVLIKGARPFRFEEVVEHLSLQAHRTVLEVDLDALSSNLRFFSRLVHPETRTMAVIKASAYGSGSAEIARLLQFHKVDQLAVAYADEGVELRRAGITMPILVLNADEASFPLLRSWQLEPEVYSLGQLKALVRYLAGSTPPLSVQIKCDTGMHRLGFEEADLPDLSHLLNESSLRISAVSSHLAAAGSAGDDAFTHEQARRFLRMHGIISKILGYTPARHLLNTAGIIRFPEYQFEMVRLGIGLYGIGIGSKLKGALRPALTLRSSIIQIRNVDPGETVGYNRAGKISRPTRIGTVAVGYADGLPRLTGNGRYALNVRGQSAPIIGDVCMDLCMIDLSGIPDACAGDEVIVFGSAHPVEELAKAAMTIPYEIFTNVSPRVKRIYIKE